MSDSEFKGTWFSEIKIFRAVLKKRHVSSMQITFGGNGREVWILVEILGIEEKKLN